LSPRIVTATRPCVSIKRTTLTNPSRWFPAHGITPPGHHRQRSRASPDLVVNNSAI
jgi:hypothetical protein